MGERGYRWALRELASDLEFEQNAVKLYGTFAAHVQQPELKEMFKDIARAEAGHVTCDFRRAFTLPRARLPCRLATARPRRGHEANLILLPGVTTMAAKRHVRIRVQVK